MGHDISAYKIDINKDEVLDDYLEVAELRRSAFNPFNKVIYQALNALEHYAVVSGQGTNQIFNKEELEIALEFLSKQKKRKILFEKVIDVAEYFINDDLQPETKFIEECLKNLSTENQIRIAFF